ncbi:hypothetical protein Tco_0013092 [Tanacetum coccineum]
MGDENPICTLGDYSKPSHEGYKNTIELPVGNNVVPLRSDTIRLVQNGCSFHGLRSEDPNQHLKDFLKLVDSFNLDGENRERTCLQDLSLYDNEIWNDSRDFAKPVKAIALPQDVPSTSVRRLIELENQVQRLMEAYLAPTQPTQVNKVTTSCEICIGPHDTRYCMEDPKHAFVEYASSHTDEAGGNSMAPKSIAAISQVEREELRKKGIKSPSKLFSPKYLSPASIKELNKNSSAPKHVYFVNSIVVLSKDSNTEEEDVSLTNAREHDLKSMVRRKEEAKEQCKEEDDMGTTEEVEELFEDEESKRETEEEVKEVFDDKTKEEEDDDTKYYNSPAAVKELVYHEWLLENPQPS